jgi:hypothetical protein
MTATLAGSKPALIVWCTLKRVRAVRFIGVSLVLGPLVACAAVLGVDEVGYGPDAGDLADARLPDATTNDAPSDAPAPGDAADGGPSTDATDATRTFCTQQDAGAGFCDDFDIGQPGALWLGPRLDEGGTFAPTVAALSPPNAVAFTIVATSADAGNVSAYLYRRLPFALPPVHAIRYEFAVALGAVPLPLHDYYFIASLVFQDAQCTTSGGTKERAIELGIAPNGSLETDIKGFQGDCIDGGDFLSLQYSEGVAALHEPDGGPRWTRIAVELASAPCSGGSSAASMRIALDGTDLAPCVPLAVDPATKMPAFEVHIGFSVGNPRPAANAAYDDVLLRIE